MKLILDTHALLWFLMDDRRLGKFGRAQIEDPANTKVVSIASLWEIVIKASLGKIELKEDFRTMFPKELRKNGFKTLTAKIKHLHVLQVLPRHHGDPFDRMIIAQAKAENMPVVTVDPEFRKYDIQVVW